MSSMRAIVVERRGDASVLTACEMPRPQAPSGSEILVRVKATSVNPVDIKVRAGKYDDYPDYYDHAPAPPHIIGFDCAGTVEAIGSSVTSFSVGDDVYFSSDPFKQASNAEYTLVEEGLVAKVPRSLDLTQAASMPLTWLTAWEALVDRLEIKKDERAALLIINGAGGVGAVATQIAREILKLPVVITTASRDETVEFTKKMGATQVVNHREKLEPQIAELKLDVPIKYIFISSTMDQYVDTVARIAAPFGKICSIVQGQAHMYGTEFMAKSLTFCWELISTKARYGGIPTHGQRLAELAKWVDEGRIQCHMTKRMKLNLKGLKAAHELVESGKSIGKVGLGIEDEGDGEAFM